MTADNITPMTDAQKLYSSGRYSEVIAMMKALLESEPDNVVALNIAAACSHRMGKVTDAEGYWRGALRVNPEFAEAHNNLGVMLQETGRFAEAEICYRNAVSTRPGFADAHYNMGIMFDQLGRSADAAACYEHAVAISPDHAQAHNNLGNVLSVLGRFPEAEASYRRALSIRPDFREALHNLRKLPNNTDGGDDRTGRGSSDRAETFYRKGNELKDQARLDEAEACYRKALSIHPEFAAAHFDLGNLLKGLKRSTEAEACYRRAIAISPDFVAAHFNLGNLLTELRRLDEGRDCFLRVVSIVPDFPEGHFALGNVCVQLSLFADSERCYLRALALRPDFADALNNLGNLLREQGRFDEAEHSYRRLLSLHPEYADARWNLALLLLYRGRFQEGWPLLEARYDSNLKQPTYVLPELPYPQWKGEDLRGRSIVIWLEQGFGDQIQFVRYLPLLRKLGATVITMVVTAPLKALLTGSFTDHCYRFLSQDEAGQLAPHDFWTFPMSLPLQFGTTLESIPAALPYLTADAARSRRWSAAVSGTPFKVGLVWKGSPSHKNDGNRSLPGLSTLAPLWQVPNVTFVSLQKGAGEDEASSPPPGQPLLNWGSEIDDFADAAAIVQQLDLVICVDTATAHLAASLGKPCWVLLPAFGTDWRWMEKREDSPWYPGVMRLFRQTAPGDWDGVIERVAKMLSRAVGSPLPD